MKYDDWILMWVSDPSHAWLRVPLMMVKGRGLGISSHSYIKGDHAYLEEDCDAPKFIKACCEKGAVRGIKEQHYDKPCFIRELARYKED